MKGQGASSPLGGRVKPDHKRKPGSHGAVKPRPAGTLKAAVSELIDAVGQHDRAGEICEVSKGQVQRWTDPDGEAADRYPGVQKIRALEAAAGEPIVTRFLAAEAGYVLVKPEGVSTQSLPLLTSLLAGEIGDVLRAIADGTADDGKLDAREAGRLADEILQAMGVLASAYAVASSLRDGGAP